MTAEIVCIGTELLLGNIVNTNTAFMAQRLAEAGCTCYYQSVVGDNPKRMAAAIRTALGRSDIVLVNGGLGPTEDDLTTEVAAKVMKRKLVEDEATRRHIEKSLQKYMASNSCVRLTQNNWKMALVPEGSIILENRNGQAPGIIMEENGKAVILLPGPPNELLPMFDDVMLYLKKTQKCLIKSKTVKIIDLGESMVADMITDLFDAQTNPTIATYAKTGEVHVRVTAYADSEKEADQILAPMIRRLRKRFGKRIFTTEEDETLEEVIVRRMKRKHLTLTCAESCTGGLISSRIVNVPGASDVLMQGLVTYANEAKMNYLGVREETLRKFGAVSRQTAEEMAQGGCRKAGTDACIAVTGIAGPGGGTKKKPVGLVYISCCLSGETKTRELHLSGNRGKIREQAAQTALVLLRNTLEDTEERRKKA